MMPVAWAIPCLLLLSAAGIVSARSGFGRVLVYGGCLLICIALGIGGVHALTAANQHLQLPVGLPWIGTNLRLDALAGFFLILIGLGGGGASLFALGYARHEEHPQRVLPFYPAFLAGMILVVLADDAFTFLFAWELMSLTSWALVMAHHREEANARAGYVYLIMATFSGLTLLLAFGLLAGDLGNYAFDSIRNNPPSADVAGVVMLVALVGAGSKAGLVPLHVWLPLAHPAAPSHVSALMSGVMTKVAVYGFIRIVFDLVGPTQWWAGTVVLAIGGITAVIGVLQALMERDLKRLLAYSTVENIGIIFIGLGLSLAFRANNLGAGAALALTAALFHALNHTTFKSLLFFGAGAVLHATGQRDMETLGGLIHRMKVTPFVFLIGCIAISGLPPLNGFASEWLTFQAVLLRPEFPQWGLKLLIPVDGALLALAAALASCCFVRAYGICFLGRPRSNAAAQARETDAWSLAAMIIFAALCLLTGIIPGAVIDTLAPVARDLTGARMPVQLGDAWQTIVPIAASRSSYNGLLVFAFITISILITVVTIHRLSAHGVRRAPPWDCGFPDPTPLSQYSAASFEQPIRRVFGTVLFRSKEVVDMPPPGDNRPAGIVRTIHDPAWEGIYRPLAAAIGWMAGKSDLLAYLTIRSYLSFVFAALVVLLIALTIWQ
jgi:formate hydrogenlyase subunit 3/multisubunit Na+/H+ antiporter MnhD subunit